MQYESIASYLVSQKWTFYLKLSVFRYFKIMYRMLLGLIDSASIFKVILIEKKFLVFVTFSLALF